MTLKFRLLLGGAIVATAGASPLHAQTLPAASSSENSAFAAADEGSAADSTEADSAIADGAAADEQLDAIVITALRRATDLQDTPISISVMDSEDLANRHVQSLMDLADGSIPGLRIATFEARQSALTIGIRGIVPLDANQPAREQGVGVYVDGVYLGRQHGLGAALLDIERIEVLKGPQGTLFGRNTSGGAVNMITHAPTGEFGFRSTIGVGNFNGYNAEAHVDFPAIGQLALKLDAAIQHQDATTENPLPGAFGWNYYHRRGLRLQARWTPSERFTADLSGDIGRDENTPFYSQLLNYNPNGLAIGPASGPLPAGSIRPLPPIVVVEGEQRMEVADIGVPQQLSVDRTTGTALRLSWEAAPWIELRSISAYRQVEVEQWDNAGGAHRIPVFTPNGNFSRYSLANLWQHQWSQELQAIGTVGDVDYTAGLYYFTERAEDDAATPNTNRWNADGTGFTILDPGPTIPGRRVLDRASVAFSRSYAAYGQGTWSPDFAGGMFHLTLGGRYTHDRKNGRLFIVNNSATNFTFRESESRFDPLVSLQADVAPDVQLYARYATGYRAGGASSRSLTYRSFGPEEVISYEIGAKTELFDRRLRLNVAAFAMNRTGSQIDFNLVSVQPNGSTRNTLETINAPGTTHIRGVEVEARARLTDALTLSGAYAYTYTSIPPTTNPFNGAIQPVFIVFTPRNAASAAIDYEIPLGGSSTTLRAHLDANYSDATQTFDISPVKNDSSFIINGRLSLADIDLGTQGAQLGLALWARNLLDEAHVYRRDPANRATLGDYGNLNAPRTFGVEASFRF